MTAFPNAFFRSSDPTVDKMAGWDIPAGFWSRHHEYAWAIQYAAAGMVVADMGCGWHYRPFHDALAEVCEFTYGVDAHPGVTDLPPMQNGAFVVADFAQPILAIAEGSLDRVFCISVLEELINYRDALSEFKRLLKPNGRMVITMDVPYDETLPAHEKYKGVRLQEFEQAAGSVGLAYDGAIDRDRADPDVLFNSDFNLCVYHCVLRAAK